jgi:Fic family protein
MLVSGAQSDESKLDWAWRMHDEFESAHPFVDGNGRTGRLLLNVLRLRAGLPWATVLESRKHDYYRTIRAYQEHGFACQPQGDDYKVCESL